jgi:very-short-patch-repair endonuclease
MPNLTHEARKKLVNLFSFFKAVEQRRTVLVQTIDEYPWKLRWSELPTHTSLHIQLPVGNLPFSLTLNRPPIHPCPTPPAALEKWLVEGWDDPNKDARHSETVTTFVAQETPTKIHFNQDPARLNDWNKWQEQRSLWAEIECPARAALTVWNRFFALHSQLEREGETYELMLGDGFFVENGVRHPILLRRVELSFQPQDRTFLLEDAGITSEFFSPAFATHPNLPVKNWQQEVLDGDLHPLGGDGIDDWLKTVIGHFQDGIYVEGEPANTGGHPGLGRSPALFLRKRDAGKLNFIDTILNDLHSTNEVSDSLLRIVGCAPNLPDIEPNDETAYANEDADILLTKPANAAQLSILRRLSSRHGVLVQGPPGTGKTHSIANLIGSLLAEGKTILVTSHTTKALRVLREQVAAPLRPLCVSVLDSDMAGKKELENAVATLAGRLDDDPTLLAREAVKLAESRKNLLVSIQSARSDLELAINGEYRPLIVDGKEYDPTQAATDVAQGEGRHDWIPSRIHNPEAPPPISTEDLHTLYASSARISQADEAELAQSLPPRDTFWSPNDFAQSVNTLSALATRNLDLRRELWTATPTNSDFDATLERMSLAMDILAISESESWRLAAIGASMDSAATSRVWQLICEDIEAVKRQAGEAADLLYRYSPEMLVEDDSQSQLVVVDEIISFLGKGKTLSTMNLLFHPKWKKLIESMRVERGASPSTLEHFHALRAKLNLTETRNTLTARWQQHMEPHGLASLKKAGSDPEHYAAQFIPSIKVCLAWHTEHWQPVESQLVAHGLNWQQLLDEAPPSLSPHQQAERLRHTVTQVLPGVVAAELDRRNQARLLTALTDLEQSLRKFGTPSVRKLVTAIETRDSAAYQQCYGRIDSLLDLQPIYHDRKAKLGKIQAAAPTWASAIQNRQPPHDLSSPPGDLALAWRWRQFSEELDRRAALSVSDLQTQIERLSNELTETTTDLVERRAWEALIRRVAKDDMARQALLGWAITTRRLGAGTGLNAAALRRQAAEQMGKARAAVPVWIMPFSRLTENFDPVRDHFDVLIVDEASQEDVVGLAPFYMADKVIVVGDEEQVTPLDVGGEQQPIQDLIEQWLTDLPSKLLFDLKTSIYDRAHIAFGTAIRLKEHFRCVPEIIQFSNDLSYSGDIKPLRDSASTPIKPALVAHRVKGTKSGKKNTEEAEAIAALIAAAIEQPEYAGKTFGVISLVGDDQSREIENLLRNRLDSIEYEKRRILCGNPAHFQGDERDVIFLSMVDSKEDGEGPLGKRGDGADGLWKKRYNVAASRAKDQLWVVYSLDHQTQLKPDDLRRRLIEHAIDPGALMRKLEDGLARTESPFEAEVFRLLTVEGYQVKPQWPVGAYRIDMVVEGEQGKRLAIECDGDRWHYDKVAEDMARQALLERLGWRFARIRGTTFYRDVTRQNAMRPVMEKLAQAGILPIGNLTNKEAQPNPDNQLLEVIKRRANELHG